MNALATVNALTDQPNSSNCERSEDYNDSSEWITEDARTTNNALTDRAHPTDSAPTKLTRTVFCCSVDIMNHVTSPFAGARHISAMTCVFLLAPGSKMDYVYFAPGQNKPLVIDWIIN